MANPDHLAILKEGVEVWNEWRKSNKETAPNLDGANLRGIKLLGCDFSKTNLANALFEGSILHKSNFEKANLINTDFSEAQMIGAIFKNVGLREGRFVNTDLSLVDFSDVVADYAVFQSTNFSGSVFSHVAIIGSNLSEASFRDALVSFSQIENTELLSTDFTDSMFGQNTFINLDFGTTIGLSTVKHLSPSHLTLSSLLKSKFQIPREFLFGIGTPDDFVNFIAAMKGTPIEYYSCFISYSSQNQDFASRLYADLQNSNVRCWLATEDLKIGDKFRTRIEESIRLHDKLLLILSETSVNSQWVESEVESAMERERKEDKTILFPVMLDNAVMDTTVAWAAEIRRTRHIGDFLDWKNHGSYTKALDRLLRDLKAESNK